MQAWTGFFVSFYMLMIAAFELSRSLSAHALVLPECVTLMNFPHLHAV